MTVIENIRGRAEWAEAERVAQRLKNSVRPRWPHDAPKFLNLDQWLEVNLARAEKLGLLNTTGLKILDLGSGTGQFLFICRSLGHDVAGLDLPAAELESPEREIFTEMPQAFGVPVLRAGIQALTPSHISSSFDLIASFMVCFNNHKLPNEWGRAEWEFFVQDMLAHLNPGGRLTLRLNHNEERFGPRGYLDRETQEFFCSLGSLDDGEILITKP